MLHNTFLILSTITGLLYSSLYLTNDTPIGVHVVPAGRAARGPEPGLRQAVHRAAGQRR